MSGAGLAQLEVAEDVAVGGEVDSAWEAIVDAAFDTPEDPVWFYKDAEGTEQGPFSTEMMDEWVQAGHFPGHQPLRHRDQAEFGFFKTVAEAFELPEEAEEDVAAEVEAREVAAAPSAATLLAARAADGGGGGGVDSSDESKAKRVITVETAGSGKADDRQGTIEAENGLHGTAGEAVGAEAEGEVEVEGEGEGEGEEDENEPVWTYTDKQSKMQGPFSTSQMLAWVEAGFMPEDTPVRHRDDPDGEWSTIGTEFVQE